MTRFIAIAVALVVLAVLAPRVAPMLVASLVEAPPEPGAVVMAVEPGASAPGEGGPPAEPAVAGKLPSANALLPEPYTGAGRNVVIAADGAGHYVAGVRIAGRSFLALIDTGATAVVLTQATARRLGIAPPESDYRLTLRTANGNIPAAPVVLPDVRVGNIRVDAVDAVVVRGDDLDVDLLGMSFLNRLSSFTTEHGRMTLVE